MKIKHAVFLVLIAVTSLVNGQALQPAGGGSKKAFVSEMIGITNVSIDYHRPAVKGREIWGNVVHYGFADLGFGTTKEAPWRAGANDNTTIEFSTEVSIEGKKISAGKYGFFIALSETKATLIFSKYNTAWGSFYYNPKDDALRVDVAVQKLNESVERLKYEFSDQTDESAVVSLLWEKLKILFKVSVDLKKEQVHVYRKAVFNGKFYVHWQNMRDAANYCLINNVNLEEGLEWSYRSIYDFFGETNFATLSTYSGLLEKLNRKKEADSVMQKALPMATLIQLNSYARTLVRMKEYERAYQAYKINYEKYPEDGNAVLGMVRGNFAIGNKKEAIKFAEQALGIWQDANSKAYIKKLIDDIKRGADINQ
jgi:tetratricopeptide (TPR) repeat protein